MCRAVQCQECKKPSWVGCGRHVEQVLAGVQAADRCACPRAPREPTLSEWLIQLFRFR